MHALLPTTRNEAASHLQSPRNFRPCLYLGQTAPMSVERFFSSRSQLEDVNAVARPCFLKRRKALSIQPHESRNLCLVTHLTHVEQDTAFFQCFQTLPTALVKPYHAPPPCSVLSPVFYSVLSTFSYSVLSPVLIPRPPVVDPQLLHDRLAQIDPAQAGKLDQIEHHIRQFAR